MTDRTLSHYRILRKIGGGGMGEVYEAEDTRLGRHVALKLLPTHLTSDLLAIERLRREGLKAMLAGSVASFGATYSLTLTATDCVSGEVLTTAQATAASKGEILDALARISSGLRNTLGKSLASIKEYDVPIRATTSNMEALKLLDQALALDTSGQRLQAPFSNAPTRTMHATA